MGILELFFDAKNHLAYVVPYAKDPRTGMVTTASGRHLEVPAQAIDDECVITTVLEVLTSIRDLISEDPSTFYADSKSAKAIQRRCLGLTISTVERKGLWGVYRNDRSAYERGELPLTKEMLLAAIRQVLRGSR